jgi:hypothetical protein
MDGFRAEGLHNAAHLVSQILDNNDSFFFVLKMTLIVLQRAWEATWLIFPTHLTV